MPNEPVNPPSPTPATPSTVSGGTPTEPAKAEPWRAGAEAPAWARGKTGEEILAITNQFVEQVVRPAAPAPVAQAPSVPTALDPQGYVTGQDLLNAQQQAVSQFAPTLQRLAEQNALSTYRLVSSDPKYAEVFKNYGPEVSQYLARLPREQWTVDIVEGAAKLVRADHVDELVRDGAQRLIQNMEPTIRPTGGGATPQAPNQDLSLKSDKLPTEWRDRAAKVGLDERTLDEFCFANNISREQFFKTFEHGLIVEIGKVKGA